MQYDDPLGSTHGGANGATSTSVTVSSNHKASTPDGVNAQSVISHDSHGRPTSQAGRQSVGAGVTVNVDQLAEVVRGVVREELGAMRTELRHVVRDEIEEAVDSLHRDIINLKSAMLLEFLQLQVGYNHLY